MGSIFYFIELSIHFSELVVGVAVGVGTCITVLIVVGLAVHRSSCGNRRGILMLAKIHKRFLKSLDFLD